jgi:hypothetical protein
MGMGGISVWQVLLLTIFFSLVFGALRIRRRWSRRPHGSAPAKPRRDPERAVAAKGTYLRGTRKTVSEFFLDTVFGQLALSVLGGVVASMIFALIDY